MSTSQGDFTKKDRWYSSLLGKIKHENKAAEALKKKQKQGQKNHTNNNNKGETV